MAFENLIGNEKIKELLFKMIKAQKITHSYLFLGPSGVRENSFCKRICKNDFVFIRYKIMWRM